MPTKPDVTYPEKGCQIKISKGRPKKGYGTYTPHPPYGSAKGKGKD